MRILNLLVFTWMLFSNLFIINVMHALCQCHLDQKTILLQIRRELTYDSLASKLVQWDERVDCCEWPGVSCNDAGYITGLDLSDDELITGGFNVSLLLKLSSLSVIRLDGLNFSAPFPDLFADFTNLSVLSLAECNFIGTVPQKVFQVSTLQEIDLTNNNMLGGSLPDFLENGSLKSLKLGQTKFSGILPESIRNLRMLSHIDLSDCNFSGEIPSSHWDGLDNLQFLFLTNNSFSGPFPVSLFYLPSLRILDLSGNKFSGEITELQNVTSPLKLVALSSNNLEGPIPSFFFQLQNLYSLSLSSNKFKGTVHLTNFRNPENFVSLDLSDNSLVVETNISTAELPILPQFQNLMLGSCNLQQFPLFLKNQSKLMMLDLSRNTISGEIPTWIWGNGNGKLQYLNLSHNHLIYMQEPKQYSYLNYLDLHSNLLSGRIPRLPRAVLYLDLSSNNFSSMPLDIGDQIPSAYFFSIANNKVGIIPPSLCHAANLEVLDMSNNALQGTIPPCLVQNNSNLGVINLKGNHLSGEIPQMFLHSCSLEILDLSQNLLEGQLPPSLVNCTKLMALNLGNNRISDTFPCWLNKLLNLRVLALRYNQFHGSISCPMSGVNNSWPSLQVIDLSSNNFSGIIPADLFLELKAILVDMNKAQSKLDYVHFRAPSFNELYYEVSVSLFLKGQSYNMEKVLTAFTSIDFSNNQFQGSIPESVGELKLLHLLNISHNALTGNIPSSLENLKDLEALDLSFNGLTGNIPDQLVSLTFLSFLNLSHNHLVGRIPQGNQFKTFGASSFMENKGLCGFPINVSCSGNKEQESPLPELEEEESSYHAEIYTGIALGFVVGLGGIFLPLLLSKKWRSYYNEKIDEILSKIFYQRGQGRTRFISKSS